MGTLVLQGQTSGQTSIDPVDGSNNTLTLPTTVLASTDNVVSNKIAIVINGTTYYLLASTSGA